MSQPSKNLATLQSRLEGSFKGKSGPDVRLLPDDQMQIAKNLAPNQDQRRGAKGNSLTPDKDGYKIYVACRAADKYEASVSSSQRVVPSTQPVPWDSGSMKLRVDPSSLVWEWRVLNRDREVVIVSVQYGSDRVVAEVNGILAEVEAVLLH
jgi:hypothetical protein